MQSFTGSSNNSINYQPTPSVFLFKPFYTKYRTDDVHLLDEYDKNRIMQEIPFIPNNQPLNFWRVGNVIVCDNIFAVHFDCDLESCHGVCCIEGNEGATLCKSEIPVLAKVFPKIKPYMVQNCVETVERKGLCDVSPCNELTTTMVKEHGCAYAVKQDGKLLCVFHQAYENSDVEFKKPMSCDLSPIRVGLYQNIEVLYYRPWSICQTALANGMKNNVKVFQFSETALRRKYGNEWYEKVVNISQSTRAFFELNSLENKTIH